MTTLDDAYRALAEDHISPKVEALIEAMFLAAVADGSISPEEAAKFAATVSSISKGKIAQDAVNRRVGELTVLFGNEGRKARIAAVKNRLAAGAPRETALLLAAAITASDGEVVWSENTFLADLAEELEIPATRAVDLVSRVRPT